MPTSERKFTMNDKKNTKKPVEVHAHAHMDDDETISREEWNPSSAQMTDYLRKEKTYAVHNITLLLKSRSPMTIKEMKESSLHSIATLEATLQMMMFDSKVEESQGKYSL